MVKRRHYIEADGVRLHVEESGEGPPLLFGHSLFCDRRMFAPQVADLSRDHRVLNLDFRGHGDSSVPPQPFTMADQALDYLRVLDALAIDRAVVVGLSMGAMAALHLALAHPQRVVALVLMNTSAAGQDWSRRLQFRALGVVARTIGVRPFLQRRAATAMFSPAFRRGQPEVVRDWSRLLAQMPTESLARCLQMVLSRPSVVSELPQITQPVLVVGGDHDNATPVAAARVLAERLPHARLEILPTTGHLSTIERPQETTRLIRSFLEEIEW